MKKVFLFLVLFLFPFMVFAKDTCDSNAIKIQSIELENSTGHMEELSESSISNQKINLGLKMDVVGDSAEYKIVVKNNSLEDYYFDEKALNIDMESVNYEVSFDDNTNLMKAGEEKVVYLKVSYKEQMDATNFNNGIYDGNQVVKLNFMTMENPFTGRFLGLIIFISLIIGFFVLYKDRRKTSYLLLIIGLILPFTVKAVCKYSVEVNTNLVIDARNAIFLPGKEFNIKVKQLVGDDTSTSTKGYNFKDELVLAFHYSDVEPIDSYKEDKNLVSTPESNYPIYVWFDNGTLYWWSEDKTPSLNEDASNMLSYLTKLEDVTGIDNFDSSRATDLSEFFLFSDIRTADDLIQWNTSNVEYLQLFFMYNDKLSSIDGVEHWDVRKVKDLSDMFRGCLLLEEIDLSNWETPSLIKLSATFSMTNKADIVVKNDKLKRIILSDKFDTSKVEYFAALATGNTGIEDWSFLEYIDTSSAVDANLAFGITNLDSTKYMADWDVSKIYAFNYMFFGCNQLTSLEGLEKWDISGAKWLNMMFDGTGIENAEPIKNWNTSNVTEMSRIFSECNNLKTVDLSNWDTSNVTGMSNMFDSCPNLENVNVNNLDTSNVTNMAYMFSSTGLTELDLSSFNTKKVTSFKRMFNGSNNLEKIYVGENWDTSANTDETKYVFPTDSNLPNFSNTNPNYRDLSYAHTGEGGYLTLKTN